MSSDNTNKLTRLLHTFDAQRLGEGDMAAGANVLAAMACAIANIHRHGARIALGDGPSYRIGSSVRAYVPLTSALIVERVSGVLAEYQSTDGRMLESFTSETAKRGIQGLGTRRRRCNWTKGSQILASNT